jgi:predicted  nucleic acid-binding Zn-ribbon protein
MRNQNWPGRSHDRLTQDVASLSATVRKVEAEQRQLSGTIAALSVKLDAFSEKLSSLGRPNYQAAGFFAMVLMAFGGLVWNFLDGSIKAIAVDVAKISEVSHVQDVANARIMGSLEEQLQAAKEKFDLLRSRLLETHANHDDRLNSLEVDVARISSDLSWHNARGLKEAKHNGE